MPITLVNLVNHVSQSASSGRGEEGRGGERRPKDRAPFSIPLITAGSGSHNDPESLRISEQPRATDQNSNISNRYNFINISEECHKLKRQP